MNLNDANFTLYAAKYYDNPHCDTVEEFEEDLKRIQYIRKLFTRYRQGGDLKERLILNHLIILFNCFGTRATDMIFMKMEEYSDYLKPFVEYLNFMPSHLEYAGKRINTDSIKSNPEIQRILREL